MAQAKDEAGNVWEVDAQGNPVRLIRQAGIQTKAADPEFPHKGRIAGNKAAASDYDPAIARAELRVKEQQAATAASAEAREGAKFAREDAKPIITDGQKKTDEEYAKEYVAWTAAGGYSTVKRQLDQLNDALRILKTSDTITGPVLGRMPEFIQQAVDPESLNIKAQVEDVIQRSLRATLGAQFTQAEGDRMIARAFDPRLQESDNAARLLRIVKEIDGQAQAKESSADYFEKNGTLAGWSLPDDATVVVRGEGSKIVDGDDAQAVGPYGRKQSSSIVDNPALAGANAGVLQRLQQGQNTGQIQEWLTTAKEQGGMGMDSGAVVPILGQIQKAVQFYKANPGYRGGHKINIDDMVKETSAYNRTVGSFMDSGPGAFATQAVNSVLPLDEFANITGYDGNQMEQAKQYQRREYPWSSGTGQLAGNVTGFVGANKALGPVVRQTGHALERLGLNKLGKYTAGSAPAAADVVYGTGYGAFEDNENRLRGAIYGAGSTVTGNLAGKYLAAPIGRGIYSKFADTPEKPGALARMVGKMPDELPQMRADLADAQRMNIPLSLADTNPQLRMLAGSATRKSPSMRQMAEDVYEPRQLDQVSRLNERISADLTPPVDPKALGAEIRQQAQTASKPYYDEAFARPAPVNDELAELLQNPTLQESLGDAARIASNEGKDPLGLGFDFNDAGDVIGVQNPTWETLDLIKRGIDQKLAPFRDPFGRLNLEGNPLAQSIEGLRQKYVSVLDNQVGADAYKTARGKYAEAIAPRASLDMGKDAFASSVPPRDVRSAMGRLSDPQKTTYGQGYATQMADTANNVRDVSNPYKSVYGGTSQKEKLATIFPEGAPNFDRAYNLENQMSKTAYETTGGSPTQARNQADAHFDDQGGPISNVAELGLSAATGMPNLAALGQTARLFGRDAVKLGLGKRAEQRANAMGPILMDTDPRNALASLEHLERQLLERQQYVNKSRNIGGIFGRPLIGSAGLAYSNNQ